MGGKYMKTKRSPYIPFVSEKYPPAYVERAHKATFANESQILENDSYTCFYCGHTFKSQMEEKLWITERAGRENTLQCPMCGIDCLIGSAPGFPLRDPEFVRISDGLTVERLALADILLED
jgi:DNA-directed RNA polymerase subunit RPC12/RpoP